MSLNHEIQTSREENERSIQYSNHNYKVGLNSFGNSTWICSHVNDLTLVGVVWSIEYS